MGNISQNSKLLFRSKGAFSTAQQSTLRSTDFYLNCSLIRKRYEQLSPRDICSPVQVTLVFRHFTLPIHFVNPSIWKSSQKHNRISTTCTCALCHCHKSLLMFFKAISACFVNSICVSRYIQRNISAMCGCKDDNNISFHRRMFSRFSDFLNKGYPFFEKLHSNQIKLSF